MLRAKQLLILITCFTFVSVTWTYATAFIIPNPVVTTLQYCWEGHPCSYSKVYCYQDGTFKDDDDNRGKWNGSIKKDIQFEYPSGECKPVYKGSLVYKWFFEGTMCCEDQSLCGTWKIWYPADYFSHSIDPAITADGDAH